jgi:glycosyltransferase involved in cell wall biosynthesis
MFCSTIIPTVGRETLARAVRSVLDQEFDRHSFEVIVVNDSGQSLPEEAWQRSDRVQVIQTNRRERSVARNAGAAIAKGRYLHFLDDDDWMLPEAFKSFSDLSKDSQAGWLYGGYRLVDSAGKLLEECHPNESGNCLIRFMAGEWQPIQASFIDSRAFFAVGGFASLSSLLGGDEDVDLARQITLRYDIAGISQPVATIRVGLEGSTTNYSNLQEQSRQSREKALSAPGALARLRKSAQARKADCSYWYGRVLWVYLGSVLWNLQHKRLFTAASRMVYTLSSLGLAGRHLWSPRFWSGATRPHIANGWLHSEK